MNGDRNRLLMVIAGALAAVKFLLMPLIESQDAAAENLAVLTARLDRATGVVQNQVAIKKAVADFESATTIARRRFPDSPDAQSFRLDAQQSVTALASQSGFAVKSFEWVLDGQVESAQLEFSRARFQIDGPFRQLVTLQATLEARFPNMFVREMNLVSPNMILGPDESSATLTLVTDFHFRPAAPSIAQ